MKSPRLFTLTLFVTAGLSAATIHSKPPSFLTLNEEENPDPAPDPESTPPPVDLLVPNLDFTVQAIVAFVLQYGPYSQYSGEEADSVRASLESQYLAYITRQTMFVERMNAPASQQTVAATAAPAELATPRQLAQPETLITSEFLPVEELPEPSTFLLSGLALLYLALLAIDEKRGSLGKERPQDGRRLRR